jgi:hypothetical protein
MRRAHETMTLDLTPKEHHEESFSLPHGLPAHDHERSLPHGFPRAMGRKLLWRPHSIKENNKLAPVAQWIEQRFPNRLKRYLQTAAIARASAIVIKR